MNRPTAGGPPPIPPSPGGASPGAGPQLARHLVVDPMHPGLPVGIFDHPAGWQAQSQVVWNTNNFQNLALLFARAFDPAGPEAWEMYPWQDFWTSAYGTLGLGMTSMADPMAALGNMIAGWLGGTAGAQAAVAPPPPGFAPPGRQHVVVGGLAYGPEYHAPMAPADALVQFVIPRFRGRIPGLRILGVRRMPQLADMLGIQDVARLAHDGAAARLAYVQDGIAIEEEFLCGGFLMPDAGGGQQNWGLKPITSFRAAAGRLDALLQRCFWIPGSLQVNPQWAAMLSQFQMQLNAGQQYAQGAMNQETLAADAGLRQAQTDYFASHQQIQASLAAQSQQSFNNRMEGFGDMMMGRTAYVDPSSAAGQPHYDYGYNPHVWTDNQGNWQHSQDPNYDPNVGADRTWNRAVQPVNR